jgi:CheY-like chemotaxis protein
VLSLVPEQQGSRLLAVDDKETNLTLLREMLEPLGFTGDLAASAFEAERQRFAEAGLGSFVAKPFREADLLDTLCRVGGFHFLGEAARDTEPVIAAWIEGRAGEFDLDAISGWLDRAAGEDQYA